MAVDDPEHTSTLAGGIRFPHSLWELVGAYAWVKDFSASLEAGKVTE